MDCGPCCVTLIDLAGGPGNHAQNQNMVSAAKTWSPQQKHGLRSKNMVSAAKTWSPQKLAASVEEGRGRCKRLQGPPVDCSPIS